MACIHALTNCLQAYEKGYKTQNDERSILMSREQKISIFNFNEETTS